MSNLTADQVRAGVVWLLSAPGVPFATPADIEVAEQPYGSGSWAWSVRPSAEHGRAQLLEGVLVLTLPDDGDGYGDETHRVPTSVVDVDAAPLPDPVNASGVAQAFADHDALDNYDVSRVRGTANAAGFNFDDGVWEYAVRVTRVWRVRDGEAS